MLSTFGCPVHPKAAHDIPTQKRKQHCAYCRGLNTYLCCLYTFLIAFVLASTSNRSQAMIWGVILIRLLSLYTYLYIICIYIHMYLQVQLGLDIILLLLLGLWGGLGPGRAHDGHHAPGERQDAREPDACSEGSVGGFGLLVGLPGWRVLFVIVMFDTIVAILVVFTVIIILVVLLIPFVLLRLICTILIILFVLISLIILSRAFMRILTRMLSVLYLFSLLSLYSSDGDYCYNSMIFKFCFSGRVQRRPHRKDSRLQGFLFGSSVCGQGSHRSALL